MKTLDALLTGATLLGVAACAALVLAEPLTISGPARVIDGDTVVVNGVHVRLKGVELSERGTERGDSATAVMLEIVGNGDLSCRLNPTRLLP